MDNDARSEIQAVLLEEIEEDICYVIECWAQDLTGESKGELRSTSARCEADKQLDERYRTVICRTLTDASDLLRSRTPEDRGRAISSLGQLRQAVRNSARELRGLSKARPTDKTLLA